MWTFSETTWRATVRCFTKTCIALQLQAMVRHTGKMPIQKIIFVYYLLCATAATTTSTRALEEERERDRAKKKSTDPCAWCNQNAKAHHSTSASICFLFCLRCLNTQNRQIIQSVSRHTSVSSYFGLNIYMDTVHSEEVHFPKINSKRKWTGVREWAHRAKICTELE